MIKTRTWYLIPLGDNAGLKLVFANDQRSLLFSVRHETQGSFELRGKVATLEGPLVQGRVTASFDGDTPRIVGVRANADLAVLKIEDLDSTPDDFTLHTFLAVEQFKRRALISTAGAPVGDGLSEDPKPEELSSMFDLRADVERRIARARGFFHRLERLSRLDQAIPGHERIYRILAGRIEIRAAYGKHGLVAELPRLDEDELATAVDISSFLRTLLLAEAREDLPWTLELFATERLAAEYPSEEAKVLYNQGVPNGEDFFKFTEFALLALQHGLHETFWSRVLVHFVRASQVYAEHAYIGNGLFGYDEQRPPYPLARISELRRAYANDCPCDVLEQRFTSILGQRLQPFFEVRPGPGQTALKHEVTFPRPETTNHLVQSFLAML